MFSSSVLNGLAVSNSHLNHTYFNSAVCNNVCAYHLGNSILPEQHFQPPSFVNNIFANVQIKAKLFNYQVQTLCSQNVIGCGSNTKEMEAMQLSADQMTIYPNAAGNMVNVTLTVYVDGEYRMDIIDITGKVIQ